MVVIFLGNPRPSNNLSGLVHTLCGLERLFGSINRCDHADRPSPAWRGGFRERPRCVESSMAMND